VSRSSGDFFWKIAVIYLFVTFIVIVRKYYLYKKELKFLREFHHLSQTMDDIRVMNSASPFDNILEAVVRIVGFDRAILFLKDPDSTTVRAVKAFNIPEEVRTELVIKRTDTPSIVWKVLETVEPIIVNSPVNHPEVNQRLLEIMKSTTLALAPIIRGKESLGVLLGDRHRTNLPISDDDLLQLQVLADQIGIALKNFALHEEISKKAAELEKFNSRINRELALARIVQEGVIPKFAPNWKGLGFGTCSKPASFLGGDFFSFFEGCRRGKRLCKEQKCENCPNPLHGILIGDVSGKGIPAAMMMAVINPLFREKIAYFGDPGEIMNQVNLSLKTYMGAESRFNSSAFLGFYAPALRKFFYANAGHDFPIFFKAKSRGFSFLESTGTLLGIFRESRYQTKEIDLEPGDRILFYTDGLSDLFEKKTISEDGSKAIGDFFSANLDLNPVDFISKLDDFLAGSSEELSDDMTAVILVVES